MERIGILNAAWFLVLRIGTFVLFWIAFVIFWIGTAIFFGSSATDITETKTCAFN